MVRFLIVVAVLLASSSATPRPRYKAKLSEDLARSVEQHEAIARRARESPEILCALVASAAPLLTRLEREVKVDNQEPLRVTGLYFLNGPEFVRTGVDYIQLARLAASKDARLLRAMAVFEGTSEGISNETAWLVAETDFSGCHQPSKATGPLTELVGSWAGANACLRQALVSELNRDLVEMASSPVLCDEKPDKRLAAAHQNAVLMRKLPGTRGQELGPQLVRTVETAMARPSPRVVRPTADH
jgi:hypothetical protein